MNRRQFLEIVAAGLVATPALASLPPSRLPTRELGRTGLQVPIVGFGSGSRFLMYAEEDKALEALNRAIDLGICYIDTAHAYGNGRSEERVGQVMATRRHEVVLATKIPGRTADQARRQIELSLKRLRTDRVDVLHIHALKNAQDLAAIEARGGVLEAMYEAREQKLTRAIGITSHADPAALRDALERHDFDCTQMALNAGLASMADAPGGMKTAPAGPKSFERLALPVANRKHMGVIAMKVFGQEQLLGAAPVEKLLAYALSLPVSLASVGMPRLEHIEGNAAFARAFTPMSTRQRRQLEQSIDSSRKVAMLQFFGAHEDA
ncbi:MAG TPA: aldo/keto reductase [Candidatus Binatia bacterium]|jgi:aryl-alcohol dehydrogenase-like predicted oxidoreductase|nr:aldo/keto reductase [Candidatus Binatia bacterium]